MIVLKQTICFVILFSIEFNGHAAIQTIDDSIVTLTAAPIPVPLVVMPSISSENANHATQPKADKPNAAKSKKLVADNKKKTVVKAGAGSKANAEKKKEAMTVTYLKSNQECGSWFDLDGNTSDATAYQQIKNSGYTKSNAPAAVKNQIAVGVAKCNQKYLIARPINQTIPDTIHSSTEINKSKQNESTGRPVSFFGKVVSGVTQFFSNFRDGGSNSKSSKHTCSPGELLMHSNEC